MTSPTAATCAAWATTLLPENMSGTTVALNVNYVAAADGVDLRGEACVLRRGKNLSFMRRRGHRSQQHNDRKGAATYKLG